MTDSAKVALFLIGGVAASAGGWVMFRLAIRREVVRVLNEEYDYDQFTKGSWLTSRLSFALDMPTAKELAESVTPIYSTIMPEAAINDILEKGRESIYWPQNHKSSKLPKDADNALFALLRNVRDYYAAKDAQQKQVTQK
jgi:hypothetical protein